MQQSYCHIWKAPNFVSSKKTSNSGPKLFSLGNSKLKFEETIVTFDIGTVKFVNTQNLC